MAAAFINLARATERRAFMEEQGGALAIDLERVEAVDAAGIEEGRFVQLGRSWERPLTRPEVACFLSHHAVWERVAAGARPLLVLEDDVVLSRRLPELLPALFALEGREIVNLEDFGRRRFVSRTAEAVVPGLRLRRTFRDKAGSAAYVLWPAGAERLLRQVERGAAPADAFIHGMGSPAAFQADPALAIQLQHMGAYEPAVAEAGTTQIHARREKLKLSLQNLPFIAKRVATQVKLAREHARRLGPAVFRTVPIDPADFS